jgi:hypothetical protein
MDRFVSEQNVARYRKLLDESSDENQRRMVIQQLAEEMAKLRNTAGNGRLSDIKNAIPAGRLRRA